MSVLNVVHSADAILEQLAGYIDLVNDEQFCRASALFPGGTVGKHIRHTLDHFRASINTPCIEVIDYDHRSRGVDVETSKAAALDAITQLRTCLGSFSEDDLGEAVVTKVMCSGDGQCAELGSTRGREIFFALHHAIHHNAILKAIGSELGLELEPGFGTAPSTINFESGLAS
ncbi:MAG: hypothetical protein AB8C13_04300 [Phycisphaerales bacterium]